MTGGPASKFNLKKRGLLKKGNFADIIVLDQDKIASPANTENPYQYSEGLELMVVNGEIVVRDGKYNGNRNGQVLKR
ncbi:MAG: D-aminoacylase, partial [Candidatus Moraniibacteriota bacterium]